MNKRLQAELWEIQAILYLILATQVSGWFRAALVFWSLVTFIGVFCKLIQSDREGKDE